jgi:hypothetical protein
MDIGRDDTRSPCWRSRGARVCEESLEPVVHCCWLECGLAGLCLYPSCRGGSFRICCGPGCSDAVDVSLRCESRFENEDINDSTGDKYILLAGSRNSSTCKSTNLDCEPSLVQSSSFLLCLFLIQTEDGKSST